MAGFADQPVGKNAEASEEMQPEVAEMKKQEIENLVSTVDGYKIDAGLLGDVEIPLA